MKVLVTGGCGFLGSHVCELFKEKGWDVVAYDNMSKYELERTGYNVEEARNYCRDYIEALGVEVIVGDVQTLSTFHSCLNGVDYIIHTAAQPAMTIAIESPAKDFFDNALGTFNVLDCARVKQIPIAICSTIHIYGEGHNAGIDVESSGESRFRHTLDTFDENVAILQGELTPLHASKRVGELYAQAFMDTYNMPIAVFRLTGIYGPRQLGAEDHGWVANFAIQTVMDRPVKVFGTSRQCRDILYVTDAAQAFYDWFAASGPSGIYNIGGGLERLMSLGDCLSALGDIVGRKAKVHTLPKREGDLWYFCCNIEKARAAFGWQPEMTPLKGLYELVHWIDQNRRLFE